MAGYIYFDHNATTPLLPEAAAAMRPFEAELYGNPSSRHWASLSARNAVESARAQVAALINCRSKEVVFTSGGTESNNYALKGAIFDRLKGNRRTHIITTRIEHPSVLRPCEFLKELGVDITYLPVDRFGQVDPASVQEALRAETAIISVMYANNEVGTIQAIAEIGTITVAHGVLFHVDASQAVGKIPVDVRSLGVDLLTIAGHKLYGPKGVGALFIREGVTLCPLLHGAGHEIARRAGTENVAGIVGFGVACASATQIDSSVRDYFWEQLQGAFGDILALNGHRQNRLPNTLNVSFQGFVGHDILAQLPSVAASTGSACHAGTVEISPVLQAMGVPMPIGLGAIRFSLGRSSSKGEVDEVLAQLKAIIR